MQRVQERPWQPIRLAPGARSHRHPHTSKCMENPPRNAPSACSLEAIRRRLALRGTFSATRVCTTMYVHIAAVPSPAALRVLARWSGFLLPSSMVHDDGISISDFVNVHSTCCASLNNKIVCSYSSLPTLLITSATEGEGPVTP